MKLHILSDLHLEFDKGYSVFNPPKVDADILILAGDIWVGQAPINWLEKLSERYEYILYIPGNHEYYLGHTFQKLNEEYNEITSLIPNFVFLHNNVYMYDDYVFIGATLWTDYNNNSEVTKEMVSRYMSDYRLMRYERDGHVPRVTSDDLYKEHMFSKEFISKSLDKLYEYKKIVVTHHCPSFNSVHPKYYGTGLANYGFFSEMDDVVAKADLWIHGHTHEPFDYKLGQCRVICNPRGYERRGEKTGYNPALVVEV